ncbi:MAG: outer membrane beta-barrel protein [Cyclobacteriaceae bacterium]|nr:outer membrane beta-barrel protein [Cyclobacteriaceae bacterium]
MKTKIRFLFFASLGLFIPNLVVSQLPIQSKKDSKYSIGVFYDICQNKYLISGETNLGSLINMAAYASQNFGITVFYSLTPKLKLSSGLGISDFGYQFSYSGARFYPEGTYKYRVSYLELPLDIVLTLRPKRKISIIASTGLSFAFYLNRNNTLYVNSQSKGNYDDFDNFDVYAPMIVAFNAGVGLQYNYSNKISITLQPNVKLSVNKNTYSYLPDDNEWTHFSSSGVKAILIINFTKR